MEHVHTERIGSNPDYPFLVLCNQLDFPRPPPQTGNCGANLLGFAPLTQHFSEVVEYPDKSLLNLAWSLPGNVGSQSSPGSE